MKDLTALKEQIEVARITGENLKLISAGGHFGDDKFCYGDLVPLGLMEKSYYNASRDPDDRTLVWYLKPEAGFNVEGSYGYVLRPGETEEWEK